MKFQRSVFVALVFFVATSGWAVMSDNDTDEKISASFTTEDKTQTYLPGHISKLTLFDPESSVHFSRIPSEFLTAIASYLSFEDMAKLAGAGRIPNHIVALAASRIESFKLKKDKPVKDQLKFLLKALGGNNTRLRVLVTDDVKLSVEDVHLIGKFYNLENFRVPYQMFIFDTLKVLLTNADGSEKRSNKKLKSLVLPEQLDEAEFDWIKKYFPNAKVTMPITQLKKGDRIYDTLNSDFIALGPDNVYQITDPDNQVLPFILSHTSVQSMSHYDAPEFCASKGARLPSLGELMALGRAMTQGMRYCPALIPGIFHSNFWSSTVRSSDSGGTYFFDSDSGNVFDRRRSSFSYVRCVR